MEPTPPEMVPVSAREHELLGDQATTAAEWAAMPWPRPPHPGLWVPDAAR